MAKGLPIMTWYLWENCQDCFGLETIAGSQLLIAGGGGFAYARRYPPQ